MASLVAQLVKNPSAMWETWAQSLGWEDPLKGKATHSSNSGLENSMDCIVLTQMGASLLVQLVKNLSAMQETLVQFLGREDPLEKGQATHSSILGLPLWLSW